MSGGSRRRGTWLSRLVGVLASNRRRGVAGVAGREDGQVTLLILTYTLVAALLVLGTVAVTSARSTPLYILPL